MATHHRTRLIDLTGRTFGRLTVLHRVETPPGRKKAGYWQCRCSCGETTVVVSGNLRSGNSRSCGCLDREVTSARSTKHGLSQKIPEYRIWSSMRDRCRNPKNPKYSYYGGRGITVCERWDDFSLFLSDMGRRPSPKHSVERVDNSKGYSPDNCIWATKMVQARNTSWNRIITFDGQSLCIADWARMTGLSSDVIEWRRKKGWPPEKILDNRDLRRKH